MRSVSPYPVRSFTVVGFPIVLMPTTIFVLPDDLLTAGGSPDDKEESVTGGVAEPEEDPVPDGYRLWDDDQGFHLHVPEDCSREEVPSTDRTFDVFFTPNARRRFIQVRSFGPDVTSPEQALERLENEARTHSGFDGKDPNTGEGRQADEVFSYRYENEAHGPFQAFARPPR